MCRLTQCLFWLWFALSTQGQPANDHFAKSTRLSGTAGWAQGWNTGATRESGEPTHLGSNGPAGQSVWWTWHAPAHGSWQVQANDPAGSAMALYQGTSVSNLTLLASNRIGSTLDIRVAAGADYHVAVDHTNDMLVQFSHAFVPAPLNDFFTNRFALTGSTGGVVATTGNASRESGEPGFGGGPTLWWTWTAPSSSPLNIRFTGESHLLEAFTNSILGTLRPLTGLDFLSQGSGRYVMANVRPGGVYQFRVQPVSSAGPFSFVWFQTSALRPNDHLANRELLTGLDITVEGALDGATREFLEPSHGSSSGSSVWYGWRAPAGGTLRVSLASPGFSIAAAVYQGTSYGALVPLASNINPQSNPMASVDVIAGSDYAIAVDAFNASMFTLRLTFAPRPSNDLFSNGIALGDFESDTVGTTSGASKESGEPNHAGSTSRTGSVWYRWQTGTAGSVTIVAGGPGIDPVLAVYSGAQLNGLTPIASNNDYLPNGARDSSVTFDAAAHVTYHIAVATAPTNSGAFNLRLRRSLPPTITWLQPSADVVIGPGIDVELVASPSDPGGAVSEVEILRGAESIATFAAGPYVISQSALPFGVHRYHAYATDDTGLLGVSGARQIRVAPANDSFTNRFVIPQDTLVVTGILSGTTRDANEPRQMSSAQRVAWWTWTAPTNGIVHLAISIAAQRAVSVYTGSGLDNLFLAATGTNGRYASLIVEAGTEYHIAAESAFDGPILILFVSPGTAPNDSFANAIPITETNVVLQAWNDLATSEPGEPAHAGLAASRSLWWIWTAPTNGAVVLATAGSAFDTTLAVYQDGALPNLTLVASDRTLAASGNSTVTFAAMAGATYRIAVDSYFGFGEVALDFRFSPPPANDAFGQPIALSGRTNVVSGNNAAAAARESGEPSPSIFAAGKSIWWSWTAPASGRVIFNTEGSSVRSVVSVYYAQGAVSLTSLVNVTTALSFSPVSAGQFTAVAGLTYYFQVDSQSTSQGGPGDLVLRILQPESPGNDAFAARTSLSGFVTNIPGHNFNATREPGEPAHDVTQNGTAWWSWTAALSGPVSVVFQGAAHPKAAVYEGDILSSLSLVASNYPGGGATRAASFVAIQGITYQIAVFLAGTQMAPFEFSIVPNALPFIQWTSPADGDVFHPGALIPLAATASDEDGSVSNVVFSATGFGATDASAPYTAVLTNLPLGEHTLEARAMDNLGAFSFAPSVTIRVAPLNDRLADAMPIGDGTTQVTALNAGASLEAGEPNHAAATGGRSVWFAWTAPADGRFSFSTRGSSFDTLLAGYTGSAISNLVLVAANDNRNTVDTWSEIDVSAQAGATLFLAIDGVGGQSGTALLSVDRVADNDLFLSAIPLVSTMTVRARNVGAAAEANEPLGGRSLWWTWTAPSTGRYVATTAGSDFDTLLGVFTGASPGNLSPVEVDDDGAPGRNSVVRFDAIAGTQYHLAVSGYGFDEGNIRLTIATNGVPSLFEPRMAGTNFIFDALAEPGTTNVVQRSIDLTNWTAVGTSVAVDWWTEFKDGATNGVRAYRILRP